MTCPHKHTQMSTPRPYDHPVYTDGMTDENPRAHGGIVCVETCVDCWAHRAVASTGLPVSYEYSAWIPVGTCITCRASILPRLEHPDHAPHYLITCRECGDKGRAEKQER